MKSLYDLGPLRLDVRAGVVTLSGATLPLGPRAVAVLATLVERHPEHVTKAAILDAVWPGIYVEESNLAVQISAIRKVLSRVAGAERWIETLPWRGYRFAGPVAKVPAGPRETREASTMPGNLILPQDAFVGRERESAEVMDHLTGSRLVTIVGAGGIGKTRLALEVAARATHAGADGTWIVEFAGTPDSGRVAATIAQLLDVRQRGAQPLAESLCEHLKSSRALLVLDNCEHLRETLAPLVTTLLARAPQLTLLATSREPLALAREIVYPLDPLTLPARDAGTDDIADADAVRLFMARARQQMPGFALTPARAGLVATICIDLDGIPLALELAAARLQSLSIEQIAARLHDRFRLLTTPNGALPRRKQTLRAAMDWSYDLLAEDERMVLRHMAIFTGGGTAEAVAAVIGHPAIDEHAAVDILARLVRRSLVASSVQGDRTRYRLLDTTRAYAREKLDEAHATADTQRRHAEHYRALFVAAYEPSFSMSDAQWRASYTPELDNVRAALASSFDGGDPAIGIALIAPAARLLLGNLVDRSEVRGWLDVALARASEATSGVERGRLLLAAAMSGEIGSVAESNEAYARAIATLRRDGDRRDLAHALVCNAYSLVYAGRLDDAAAALAEAQPLLDGTPRTQSRIIWFGATAALRSARGDGKGAIEASDHALALCREIAADRTAISLLNNVCVIAWFAGDFDRAEASVREAILLTRRSDGMARSSSLCSSLINLVGVLVERNAHDEAREAAQEAWQLALDNNLVTHLLDYLVLRAARRGRHADAARLAAWNDARHVALGLTRQRSERRARERAQAVLDAALSAEDFARESAVGSAMDADEMKTIALRA